MAEAGERLKAALANHYRIERELGAGGMATVYLAEDLRHDRKVAVKVLRSDLAAVLGPERFLREIKIAANLQHPHVLPLYDSGQANGVLYYVMPYIEGPTLRQKLLREGELPIPEVVRILRDVADAMAHAHQHGVVHRDIKPENVMVAGRHALVTDFGVAKALREATGQENLTTAGVALGTPAHMAPEQGTEDPHIDYRSDIYSFGVMAYELLAGRPPFSGRSPQAVLAAHATSVAEPVNTYRASVPPLLTTLVMKCLEKKPADRWQTADELLVQLESVLTPSGGTAPGATVAARPPRGIRRWPVLAGLLAVVTVVAGYLYSRSLSAGPPVLAVLPFENLGAPEVEYFADGMTEEITGRLARVSGLAVIARTSAVQYKRTEKPIQQIGAELGASYLLGGTVRWEKGPTGSSRVRISPQLIRVRDGVQLWAEPYEEAYGPAIFAMQAAIAEQVANALRVKLLAPERKALTAAPTRSDEAHDFYLRGRQYSDRFSIQKWDLLYLGLEMFQKAVARDSAFALAWAWLGWMHSRLQATGADLSLPGGLSATKRIEAATQALERALSLDPELPIGHAMLGWVLRHSGDSVRAELEHRIALVGEPNDPLLLISNAWVLERGKRFSEAAALFKRAADMDPRNQATVSEAAGGFWALGELEEAARLFERAAALNADQPEPYAAQSWFHLMTGDREKSRSVLADGMTRAGPNPLLVTIAAHSYWFRILRIFEDDLGTVTRGLTQTTFGTDTVDYLLAKAIGLRKDTGLARQSWGALADWAEGKIRGDSTEALYWALRGMALAGIGNRKGALQALEQLPPSVSLRREFVLSYLSEAYVMAGDFDRAIENLESWRSTNPRAVTPAFLEADPIWDPLRGNPRFQKLLIPSKPAR